MNYIFWFWVWNVISYITLDMLLVNLHLHWYVCSRGTSGIDIDLRRVDIDQCPLPKGSTQLNIFAASDKCKKRTTDVSFYINYYTLNLTLYVHIFCTFSWQFLIFDYTYYVVFTWIFRILILLICCCAHCTLNILKY